MLRMIVSEVKSFLPSARSRVRGQWSVFGQPRADGAFWDVPVEALSGTLLGAGDGMAEVER